MPCCRPEAARSAGPEEGQGDGVGDGQRLSKLLKREKQGPAEGREPRQEQQVWWAWRGQQLWWAQGVRWVQQVRCVTHRRLLRASPPSHAQEEGSQDVFGDATGPHACQSQQNLENVVPRAQHRSVCGQQ